MPGLEMLSVPVFAAELWGWAVQAVIGLIVAIRFGLPQPSVSPFFATSSLVG
jgi:hypothetical protein